MRTVSCANGAHCFSNLFTHSTNALSTRIARTAPVTPLQPILHASSAFSGCVSSRGPFGDGGSCRTPWWAASRAAWRARNATSRFAFISFFPACRNVGEHETLAGTLRGYTCTRTTMTFRTLGNTILLPGTLSGYTCTRTTATSGNRKCYRVHYPGTRVPGRQRCLERRGTPGKLSGYTCTRTTATFRMFLTLGYNGYNTRVQVYPSSCTHNK